MCLNVRLHICVVVFRLVCVRVFVFCVFVSVFDCLCACLPVYLPACLTARLLVYLLGCLLAGLLVRPFGHSFVCPCAVLLVWSTVCLHA